jgi:cyclic pyranopterin phosphate synthase
VSDEELRGIISAVWRGRDDRYSEIRSTLTPKTPKAEMSLLGG